ncbi:MAG: DHH family phosphoesterase [Planctomycetota bacterium]|nr:DHH family phosphoesterase [Planctomycetota bacterium]
MIDWNRFKQVIDEHETFCLISHIRPDCDALGSEIGMAGVLEAYGKTVKIVNGQSTPPNLAFIDPDHRVQAVHDDIQPEDIGCEVLMILDTSAWAQLGPMGEVIKSTDAKVIIVDHHVSEDDLDAELFKNTTAEATGRLVIEAADALGVELTEKMATPLFAAIATDTGWYRFPSAGSGTYQHAARLIDAGASPAGVYADLYEKETLGRVRLRGTVLARTRTELDGQLVHTYITRDDFDSTGAVPSDTEDLINLTLEISGTRFAVIFVEQLSGGFKLSFRSRCDLTACAVAEQFNGGGHKAAAGAFLEEGTLEENQEKVLAYVKEHFPDPPTEGITK